MNVLTGVGILLLSMLIMMFLQLKSGVFLLFSHYASGKYSTNSVNRLCLFFIIGVEALVGAIYLSLYFLMMAIANTFPEINETIVYIILGVILLVLAMIFPVVYFRKGKGTRLFISRRLADGITYRAKNISKPGDALVLGFFAGAPELVFTLPLYVVSILEIMKIGQDAVSRAAIILLFIVTAVVPLFVVRTLMTNGHNLANIERSREKNKNYYRFLLSFLYLIVVVLMIFEVF